MEVRARRAAGRNDHAGDWGLYLRRQRFHRLWQGVASRAISARVEAFKRTCGCPSACGMRKWLADTLLHGAMRRRHGVALCDPVGWGLRPGALLTHSLKPACSLWQCPVLPHVRGTPSHLF